MGNILRGSNRFRRRSYWGLPRPYLALLTARQRLLLTHGRYALGRIGAEEFEGGGVDGNLHVDVVRLDGLMVAALRVELTQCLDARCRLYAVIKPNHRENLGHLILGGDDASCGIC